MRHTMGAEKTFKQAQYIFDGLISVKCWLQLVQTGNLNWMLQTAD